MDVKLLNLGILKVLIDSLFIYLFIYLSCTLYKLRVYLGLKRFSKKNLFKNLIYLD